MHMNEYFYSRINHNKSVGLKEVSDFHRTRNNYIKWLNNSVKHKKRAMLSFRYRGNKPVPPDEKYSNYMTL